MAIFNYTLPSGKTFELIAPDGTTQAQADFTFYSQVAAGSFIGYTLGMTLTAAESNLVNFELSRQERGTAGVDRLTLLAITTPSDPTVFIRNAVSGITLSIPSLQNVPLDNPITAAEYIKTSSYFPLGPETVGPLDDGTVIGVITVTEKYPPPDVVPPGIGPYKFTAPTLEKLGYLKPGTSNYGDFNCVVGTPSVWTGKDGVFSVAGLLSNPELQAKLQNAVLKNSYEALQAGGAIQTQPTQAASLSTGQIFGIAGLATASAAALVSGTASLTGNLNKVVASAFSGASALGGTVPAAVSSLLSSPVNNISTIANGAVNSLTQGVNNLTTSATTAANQLLQEATGTLVNNAAQFTAPVAAAWAQGSAILNSTLGSAQGVLNSALTEAKGSITSGLTAAQGYATNALGNLSGLAEGTLGALGNQAQNLLGSLGGSLDAFGKLSSFGVDFSLFSSDSLVSATKVAAGFSNTVNRSTVDAAVNRILGNGKIPTPSFEFPSELTAGINADIAQAQKKLSELKQQFIV